MRRVAYYKKSLNLKLGTSSIRNVMDMNALFGGFAAALSSDPVSVMNVIPAHKPSTLGVIYDRGLIGTYHDWYVTCSILISFSILKPSKFNINLLFFIARETSHIIQLVRVGPTSLINIKKNNFIYLFIYYKYIKLLP